MSTRINTLKEQGEQLFSKRGGLLSLWQDIAENFYPERADFIGSRHLGSELSANLMTSYPVIARRELGNAFSAMLRPTAKNWFHLATNTSEKMDTASKQWLERAENIQRRAMYDRVTQFTRATKEADHDFASFGQCVISTERNRTGNALLYRTWHLRDVAWFEDEAGAVSTVYRKWKPTATDLVERFSKTVHPSVRKMLEKTPYAELDCWHIVMPSERYKGMPGAEKIRHPYVSIYLDVTNEHEMEVVGQVDLMYTIPRWQTVSGSQYAYSPAVVAGLSNARALQVMTRTLAEAGEKHVNPPMIGVREAFRSDLNIFAGGFTAVDAEYDERLGEVLRPLAQEKSGFPIGIDALERVKTEIMEAFYLNKLNLPPQGGPDMTAYEVGQRVQEYIRTILPLFEPMEYDYNGRLCETTFGILLRAGVFGSPADIPEALQGKELHFTFESPLSEALEKVKAGQFLEAKGILAAAIEMDPAVVLLLDAKKATRDVFGAVAPAAWLRTEAEVDGLLAKQLEQEEQVSAQQQLAAAQTGANVVKTLGEAQQALQQPV